MYTYSICFLLTKLSKSGPIQPSGKFFPLFVVKPPVTITSSSYLSSFFYLEP
jgi:hypothetical protein